MPLPDYARPGAIGLLTEAYLHRLESEYARRLVENRHTDFHPCEYRQALANARALVAAEVVLVTEERRITKALADGQPWDTDGHP